MFSYEAADYSGMESQLFLICLIEYDTNYCFRTIDAKLTMLSKDLEKHNKPTLCVSLVTHLCLTAGTVHS